ncbi:MAG: tetratricopeptide repeat protein [Planctomycetaceae bacterium]|nr:tetratricopeptide repeat protein [Planctomycetaceae bacterium]
MDEREKAAQQWFRKGTEAMNHQNWDFAIECFSNSVKLSPGNVMYRQTKHGCIRKLYNDNGTGARMGTMKLMGPRGKIKKCRMQKDWKGVDAAAEEGLLVNPWDSGLFYDMGDANIELDQPEIAKYALAKSVELDPQNTDYLKKLGYLLRDRRDYSPAISCFQRILTINKTDTEARTMLNKLQAESAMDRGGYENAENTRDVKQEQPQQPVNAYEEDRRARKGQTGQAAPGESVEADLQHAIRKAPDDLNNYLKLAEHYRTARDLRKAQDILTKAVEVSNNNEDIAEILEDVQLAMLRNDLAVAEDRARKNPSKERIVEKAKTLKEELIAREKDIFERRIVRHPNDMPMMYQQAERYKHYKEWSKAIPLLQKAASDNRVKTDALVSLGYCFLRDGKADLGRRQLERALEGLSEKDKPDAFRQAHYWLGRIYEQARKTEQAEHHYHEILGVDYNYRDVLQRLESLQGGEASDTQDE